MAKKRKRTPFAVSNDGNLYVEVAVIMSSPLIAIMDGVPVTFFGKSKRPYLAVDTAIEWATNESKHHSKPIYDEMITLLEKAKACHAAGEVTCEG